MFESMQLRIIWMPKYPIDLKAYLELCNTVNHLIFVASKFGDFIRLAYWCILVLAVSQCNSL